MLEKIKVSNVKCQGCVATIEDNISLLEGVQKVQVNLENSIVEIEYDTTISRQEIAEELTTLGYPEIIKKSIFRR